jgi:uncharacterized membrane protein
VDCYFHNAVPSVAVCHDCQNSICATCRDEVGLCPGCRLERRINKAAGPREGLPGGIGRSSPHTPPPGARPEPPPQYAPAPPRYAAVCAPSETSLANVSVETRTLLALGYPFWPLAALALLDPKRSPAVRHQALQALGLNFGLFGLWVGLGAIAQIPILGFSAWPMLALLMPIWLVATIIYAVKAFSGDDVRIPLVTDWLEEREAKNAARAVRA